jgi:putative ABC transport system substrate-binding protein
VAIVLNPTNAGARPTLQDATTAADRLGIELISIEVSRSEDFEPAFAGILQANADALFIVAEPLILTNRKRIIDFAAQARLPAVYSLTGPVRDGGLLSYGINLDVNFGSAAVYVDKILKGANPAELPVEQPTTFELVVNLKTAQALGLTIPPEILARADEVIE